MATWTVSAMEGLEEGVDTSISISQFIEFNQNSTNQNIQRLVEELQAILNAQNALEEAQSQLED